jgi:hypothetical protein
VRNIRQWNLIAGIVLALHPIGRLRRGFLSLAMVQLAARPSAAPMFQTDACLHDRSCLHG